MIKELAGGTITAGIVTGSEAPAVDTPIKLSLAKINHVLGTSLTMEQVTDILIAWHLLTLLMVTIN